MFTMVTAMVYTCKNNLMFSIIIAMHTIIVVIISDAISKTILNAIYPGICLNSLIIDRFQFVHFNIGIELFVLSWPE